MVDHLHLSNALVLHCLIVEKVLLHLHLLKLLDLVLIHRIEHMRLDMRASIRLKGRDALLERRLNVLDVHGRHDIVS